MNIDLTSLTLVQIVLTLLALTFLDWISGVAGAINDGDFTTKRLGEFLVTHVLGKVVPLSIMAALGQGLPALGFPATPAVWALFLVGGAAYLLETLASIASNLAITLPGTKNDGVALEE